MQTVSRKNIIYILLISGLFPFFQARADVYQPAAFTLTFDALGQMLFHPNGKGSYSNFTGIGGQFFADYRPYQEVSFGLGADYVSYSGPSFSIQSFDLGGRIYPLGYTDMGEFFLQGGVGLNILPFGFEDLKGIWGHYHGNAGFGYRFALDKGVGIDLGAQYDFYSPYADPTSGIRLKAGFTFGFDVVTQRLIKTNYLINKPKYVPLWKITPIYTWKVNDTLRDVAVKLYANEDLYPLLVNANPYLSNSDFKFRDGMQLKVPPPPESISALDAIRISADTELRYIHLQNLSEAAQNGWGENWHGPSAYKLEKGDSLPAVAEKLYGDEDLYPLLVDANKDRLVHPVNLQPGVVLVVPRPDIDKIDEIHSQVWFNKDPYIWWKTVSIRQSNE